MLYYSQVKYMTQLQMDKFLIESLKNILEIAKDDYDYIKDEKSPEYIEIKEDFEEVIAGLESLLPVIKSVDDLACQDEDTITFVYELLDEYAGNFIISSEPNQQKKDLETYNKLEELLYLFLDSDEDELD